PLKNSKAYYAFSKIADSRDLRSFITNYGSLTVFGNLDHPDDVRIVGISATAADGRFSKDSLHLKLHRKGDGVDEMLEEARWFRLMIEMSKAGGTKFLDALNSRLDELRLSWI